MSIITAVLSEIFKFILWCFMVVVALVAAVSNTVAGLVITVWDAIGFWTIPYLALGIALTYAVSRLVVERRNADLSWCLVAGECARNLSIIASLSAFIQRGAQGLSSPTALLEVLPHAFIGAVIGLVLGFAFQFLGDITSVEGAAVPTVGGNTDEKR